MIKTLFPIAACCALFACAAPKQQQQLLDQQSAQATQLTQIQSTLSAQEQQLQQLNLTLGSLSGQLNGLAAEINKVDESHRDIDQKLHRLHQQHQKAATVPVAAPAPPKPKPKTESLPSKPKKVILGRLEWAWIDLIDRELKARVDTGARRSSLHASDIEYFERDGKPWVRFHLYKHKLAKSRSDGDQPEPAFEAPLVRKVKVKQASADVPEERPVVRLKVKVGDIMDAVDFTLSDREKMLYPVLLGRNFLADVAVVDSALIYTQDSQKKKK